MSRKKKTADEKGAVRIGAGGEEVVEVEVGTDVPHPEDFAEADEGVDVGDPPPDPEAGVLWVPDAPGHVDEVTVTGGAPADPRSAIIRKGTLAKRWADGAEEIRRCAAVAVERDPSVGYARTLLARAAILASDAYALAQLLIAKGVISDEEYLEAIAASVEAEAERRAAHWG